MIILIILGIVSLILSIIIEEVFKNSSHWKSFLRDFFYGCGCSLLTIWALYYYMNPIEITTNNPDKVIQIDTINDTTFKVKVYYYAKE